MATFDELRLQQLLSPINNQVNNTGITGASRAMPMINGVPMINTGAINQKLQNTDLVSQIIAANQAANQETNNTDDTAPFFFPQINNPIPQINNQISQINNPIPQINNQIPLGFDTSYGVANEPDEEQEFLPDQKSSLKDSLSSMGRNFGISSLLGMITGNPIIGLLSRGAKGLEGLNNRMQNSDFGRSRTLADYFDARKYGGVDARDRAAQQNMREARAIQTQVDRRGDSTSRVADRNRSSVTRSSAAKSKGVGGGGYTKSDSNRESYRG